jgi:hypothetical protein
MLLKQTSKIQEVLQKAIELCKKQNLNYQDIIDGNNNNGVPFDVVKKSVQTINKYSDETCYFYEIIKGSDVYFPPPPSKPRNAKLEARLVQLRKKLADIEYANSIANITTRTRREAARDPFSTYKGQMGIGLDLLVTMFTLFVLFYSLAVFYYPGKQNFSYHMVCGLCGLIIGLIIDAILLIIRSDHNDKMQKRKNISRGAATSSLVGHADYKAESVARFLSEKEKLAIMGHKNEETEKKQQPTGIAFKL